MAPRTLRKKWTIAALGVSVVPMVVLGLIVLDIQRRGLARAEKELEAAVVDEAATSVLASLDQAAEVATRINAVFSDERIDADARTRLIRDIVARAPSTTGIAFFDGEGRFVDAVVQNGAGAAAAAMLRKPPTGTRGYSGFRYEAPLSGAVKGTIVVGLSRAAIDARLRDLSQIRFGGAPDRVYLVDDETKAQHALTANVPSFANELIFTTELVDRGVDKVGTIRTMPAQSLALVVERPTDEAFAALGAARRAFVFTVGAFAAFAVIVALLVVRRFAKSDLEIERRARIEENLKRYLPEQAAAAAAADGASLALGGAKRQVTVLFADVVAFTGFAERATPEKAVAFLNELFTILSEIVFRHDGMVDKFIGDCIMAVFQGDDGADATRRALSAAEDMHAFVESNQPRWREAYAFEVKLGIGVARGDVLLGNLGSSTRMEYTVIGDAVNVAARLEMLARPKQTLATKDVAAACPDVSFASLGEHALRGKAQPVEVFEVVT